MFDRSDLRAAVEADIIDPATAGRLEAFLLSRRSSEGVAGDPESLRFLANFNDIFISIGLVLLLAGIVALSGALFGGGSLDVMGAVAASLAGAAAAWALSEYFCARRRLLLPSIVLCAAFCAFIGVAASLAFGDNVAGGINSPSAAFSALGNLGTYGGLATAAAAAGYFGRFRLPFSLFVLALAIAAAIYARVAFFGDTLLVMGGTAMLVVGLITLAIAIALDTTDPERMTRRSDFAFWLHLAAAPQVILGLRGMTLGFFGEGGTGPAIVLLLSLASFAVLSLALNRRALIVSSLLTYSIALTTLIHGLGIGALYTTIATLLILGGAVVLIGGGWSSARRIVLAPLPDTGLAARIFPPEPAPALRRA